MEKQELCNTEHVTRFLQQHIQDVALERESSSELVFGIKRGASRQMTRLITALDQQSSALAINGYGLSMTTIEEVFLKSVLYRLGDFLTVEWPFSLDWFKNRTMTLDVY